MIDSYKDPTQGQYKPAPAPEDKLNAAADNAKAHALYQLELLRARPKVLAKKRDLPNVDIDLLQKEFFEHQDFSLILHGETEEAKDFLERRIDLESFNNKYENKYPTNESWADGTGTVSIRKLLFHHPKLLSDVTDSKGIDRVILRNPDDRMIAQGILLKHYKLQQIQSHVSNLIKSRAGTLTWSHQVWSTIAIGLVTLNAFKIFPGKCNTNIIWGQLLLNATSMLFFGIQNHIQKVSNNCAEMGAIYDFFGETLRDAYGIGLIEKKEANGQTKYSASEEIAPIHYIMARTWQKVFEMNGSKINHYSENKLAHISIFITLAVYYILEQIKIDSPKAKPYFTYDFMDEVTSDFANLICKSSDRQRNPFIVANADNPFTHVKFNRIPTVIEFTQLALNVVHRLNVERAFGNVEESKDSVKKGIKNLRTIILSKELRDDVVSSKSFKNVQDNAGNIDTNASRVMAAVSNGIRKQLGVSQTRKRVIFSLARNNSLGVLATIGIYGHELPDWVENYQWVAAGVLTSIFEKIRAQKSTLAEVQNITYRKFDRCIMDLIAMEYIKLPKTGEGLDRWNETPGFMMLKYLASTSVTKACAKKNIDFRSLSDRDKALIGSFVFQAFAESIIKYELPPKALAKIDIEKVNSIVKDAATVISQYLSSSILNSIVLFRFNLAIVLYNALDLKKLEICIKADLETLKEKVDQKLSIDLESLEGGLRRRRRGVTFAEVVDGESESELDNDLDGSDSDELDYADSKAVSNSSSSGTHARRTKKKKHRKKREALSRD